MDENTDVSIDVTTRAQMAAAELQDILSATVTVCDALGPLNRQARLRVLKAAAILMLGDSKELKP